MHHSQRPPGQRDRLLEGLAQIRMPGSREPVVGIEPQLIEARLISELFTPPHTTLPKRA